MTTPKTHVWNLPRGIAAVYFGGSVDKVVVNARLAPARRRAAVRALGEKPYAPVVTVTLAELAA